jgi:hypothetical protein
MIKVVDADYPDNENEVALYELTAKYTQECDCTQSEDDYNDGCQILTVTAHSGGGGKFTNIRTNDAGWSINNVDELVDILKDFQQRLKTSDNGLD